MFLQVKLGIILKIQTNSKVLKWLTVLNDNTKTLFKL